VERCLRTGQSAGGLITTFAGKMSKYRNAVATALVRGADASPRIKATNNN
jgi:hypothetical protein